MRTSSSPTASGSGGANRVKPRAAAPSSVASTSSPPQAARPQDPRAGGGGVSDMLTSWRGPFSSLFANGIFGNASVAFLTAPHLPLPPIGQGQKRAKVFWFFFSKKNKTSF